MKKLDLFKKLNASRVSVIVYWLLLIALLGLFFTNDFGLVDIHKTAIITAVGIDMEEGEVQVTAELAVPEPSQSGENIKYTQVQGSGLTIADALNEINSKTGFFPKLQFCRLILIGDSCRERSLFSLLACFYRKNFSELTALVASCKGKASEMLSLPSDINSMTSQVIRNVLSDEVEKSANVNAVNLKDIAMTGYSKSEACYMPYVEAHKAGTSENGGNGDNVGGESGSGGGSQGGSQGGGSGSESSSGGGGGSQSESGSSGGSQGGGSSGGENQPMEFTARQTAVYSGGQFKGVLDEQQSFALALIENNIRIASFPCDADGVHYTLGMKNIACGVKLKVDGGKPTLSVDFDAKAQINGARKPMDPENIIKDDMVSQVVIDGAKAELENRFKELFKFVSQTDSDILGVKEQLYKYHTKYFEAFEGDILNRMEVKYNISVESVN